MNEKIQTNKKIKHNNHIDKQNLVHETSLIELPFCCTCVVSGRSSSQIGIIRNIMSEKDKEF
jgi:hypothetical protein